VSFFGSFLDKQKRTKARRRRYAVAPQHNYVNRWFIKVQKFKSSMFKVQKFKVYHSTLLGPLRSIPQQIHSLRSGRQLQLSIASFSALITQNS